MPSIILPGRFYSQPPGALAAADESISSLLLPAGGSMIECARYQPSSVVPFGAALTEGVGKFGRAIQGSGGGLILNNADAYSVNAYTATFVVNITAFDTWGGIFTVSNADATGRFGLQRNNATTELRVYHDNTSFTTVTGVTTADFTAGGDLVFTTSFAGTATGSLKMYLNGVLKFSGTHSIVPTASSSPRLVLLGERSASATAGTDGKVYLACLHNRQLDDAEVIALHDNPWQLFKKRSRILYFDVASGITASLTGQSIPASQGTLTPSVEVALTGQSVTAELGTVTVETGVTAALTGQSATVELGNVAPAVVGAVTGQAIPVSQGAVVADVSMAVTGQALTLSEGSVSAEVTAPLSGQEVTVSGGDVGIGGDIVRALTGQALTLSQGSVGVLAANDSGVDTHDGGGWLQPVKRRKPSKEVRNELERLFRKAEVVAEKVLEVEAPKPASKPSAVSKTQDIGLPPIAELQGLLMHLRLIQDEMTGQQLEKLAELQQQMDFARMYNIRARAALLAA